MEKGGRSIGRTASLCGAFVVLSATAACTERVELDPSDDEIRSPAAHSAPDPAAPSVGVSVPVVNDEAGLPVQTRDGWIRGQSISDGARTFGEFYRRTLSAQIAVYPRSFLEKVGLKCVVLCEGLSFEGTKCPAYADVERGRIYFDVRTSLDASYLKRAFHHELFHQIDFAEDGVLDSDSFWESLNTPGFRYTQNADRMQEGAAGRDDAAAPEGFLNWYATSSPAEDKAEVYAALVVDRGEARRRIERDPILSRKADRVRQTFDRLGAGWKGPIVP